MDSFRDECHEANGRASASAPAHRVPQGYQCHQNSQEPTKRVSAVSEASALSKDAGVSVPSVGHSFKGGNPDSLTRLLLRIARRLRRDKPDDVEAALAEAYEANGEQIGLPWHDFRYAVLDAYEKVQKPLGEGRLAMALKEADRMPVPPAAERYDDHPTLQRLVKLCAVLQTQAGGKPFFLATNAAAAEFGGVEARTISRWLRGLERDKVLQIVTKGHTGRASEYRMNGI